MVRVTITIFLTSLISCSSVKNESGQERFNTSRFTIKPTENAVFYKVVDTSALYILTNIYNNGKLKVNIPQGLKFYKNGRVGKFKNYNLSNKEFLNPKKAKMGYYKYDKNGLEIEFMSYSSQAGNFLAKEKVSIHGDTIISSYGDFDYEYVKRKLPKDFLIFNPDW